MGRWNIETKRRVADLLDCGLNHTQIAQRLGITTGPLSFGAAHVRGPLHFAFGTERARIPALKSALESRGLAVEGPVEFSFWNALSIYFSDPDGNRVEFCGFADPPAPR